jgi:hypothetical protein
MVLPYIAKLEEQKKKFLSIDFIEWKQQLDFFGQRHAAWKESTTFV